MADKLSNADIEAIETGDLKPGMREIPADVQHADGKISAWDGLELYWQSWAPNEDVRGVVCLQHGFGEHSTRYIHVAAFFVRAGYAVLAIDARGHGKSAGARGHIDRFEQFPRDLDLVCGEARKRWPDVPLFVFGHSNGGLIGLHHALMAPGRVTSYGFTSPFLGFQIQVPKAKALAGRLMSKIWPTLALPTDLPADVLSHDQTIVDQYAADPLVLSVASARWFTETTSAQADLLARAREIKAPVLILASAADELADPRVAEEVFHRLGSDEREFEMLPGLKHEALNETGWEGLAARFVGWYERSI